MHLVVCATILTNHYHAKALGTAKHTINICVVLFYAIVFICIGVYWVFPNEFDPDLEEPVEGDSLVAGFKPKEKDTHHFKERFNILWTKNSAKMKSNGEPTTSHEYDTQNTSLQS